MSYRPNANMKGGCIDTQDSPNPSKAGTGGFAGPKRTLQANPNLSNFDALMLQVLTAESTWCERLHGGETPTPPHLKRDPSPGLHLGRKAPRQDLTRRQCNTMTSPGRSSGREPRPLSFTSSVQGLTGQNPNVCSCTASD